MADFKSIPILTLLLIISATTRALYEDQVGKFDWRRPLIGKVKQAQFDNKRLYVTTEENVLACLSAKTGQILWRQLLEHQQQPYLLQADNRDVLTVSGARNLFYIRTWDPITGSLLHEATVTMEKTADSTWTTTQNTLIHIQTFPNSHLEITHYNPKTLNQEGTMRKIDATWLTNPQLCTTAHPYYVCTSHGQLFWIDISTTNKVKTQSIQSLTNQDDAEVHLIEFHGPKFLLLQNTRAVLIKINEDSLTVELGDLQSNAIYIDDILYQLEVNADNPEKLIKVTSRSLTTQSSEQHEVEYPLGLGAPYIAAGQCHQSHCDLLLSSTDHALTLIKIPDGKVQWTREESLSDLVAVEFFELPVSELDASIENEFKTSSNDIVSMLIHRLSTQFKQLTNLIMTGGQFISTTGLIRDEFGLHKIIVMVTKIGKLIAIDTLSGQIVWTYRLPNVKPFNERDVKLLVQRTARYAPYPAQCILLAEDAMTGNGVLFQFDPITGQSVKGIQRLDFVIKQALLLPHENDEHIKPLIVLATDNSVRVYPENGEEIVREFGEKTFIYTVDDGLLRGYQLNGDLLIKQAWQVNLGQSAHLAAVSTRPNAERVHSQGRVLPDRSVYYKYVNPNLIAIAVIHPDPVHKHVLSVYLIDGVTGLVLYSTCHRKAKGPVYLVHSENWLVYVFFNERYRRNELVAAELYEGYIQSNSTAFSSFAVSQLPHIQSQAYIVAGNPVAMGVTLTERGITNKFLLVAMSNGGVVEIPWLLVQPRFADVPCGAEESCIPYMPEIPMPAEAVINYNQSLGRIRGVEVAPARLESTSHVLVHGLDLFYTRVAPSKTFDVLKEDFDHRLIVLVLSGLIVASYVTKYLAARKALRQAWK